MKENRVLFSPVGTSDPIRGGYDGPMLHILRQYKPRKAVLFLTAEMMYRGTERLIYTKTIEKLCKLLGFECEVELSPHPEITEPNNYEGFDEIFKDELKQLHAENPESDILLNVTSGTPQMQSSLNILSLTIPFKVYPIQVTNPEKSAGKTERVNDNYDIEGEWDNLLDNLDGNENRCVELKNRNLNFIIATQNIKSHIENYDYEAAYTTALSISEFMDERDLKLLECLKYKSMFNLDAADNLISKTGVDRKDIFPRQTKPQKEIFEYILYMDNKRKRTEYLDFCRAISPVFTELMIKYFETISKKPIDSILIYKRTGSKPEKWISAQKIAALDNGATLKKLNEFYTRDFEDVRLSARPLAIISEIYIIEHFSGNDMKNREKTAIEKLCDFERDVRNHAAHELADMTEEKMQKLAGLRPSDVIKELKILYSAVFLSEDSWDNYDKLNSIIKERI